MVRATFYMGTLTLLCSAVMGMEINVLGVPESQEYRSGAKHAEIMAIKMVYFYQSRILNFLRANLSCRQNGTRNLLQVQ